MKNKLLTLFSVVTIVFIILTLQHSSYGQDNVKLHVTDDLTVYGLIESISGNAYWRASTNNFGAGLRIDVGEDNPKAFVSYTVKDTENRFKIDVVNAGGNFEEALTIRNGNIGIGVTNPAEKLTVDGRVCATALRIIETSCWADYVFLDDYLLLSLPEVEAFINEYKHLPNTPTAEEIEQEGLDVGSITINQQEKIEEIFLYIIRMNKEIELLKQQNEKLQKMIKQDR